MTVAQSFTALMNAARDYYQVDRNLSVSALTELLKPNPNLLTGTDDFSNPDFAIDDHVASLSDKEYMGIKCYHISANAGGHGVGIKVNLDPGPYTFSFFLNCSDAKDKDAFDRDLSDGTQFHHAFPVKSGWNHYYLAFNSDKALTALRLSSWTTAESLLAGFKIESGSNVTPYLRKDGSLVKAPEVNILGGVVKALLCALLPVRGCAA